MGRFKISSYNLNGIRAAVKKGLIDWLNEDQPNVFCIQETKAQDEQIPKEDLEKLGYHVYSHSAQKKGYSGVAICSKEIPKHVEYGSGIPEIDFEGRIIRADYKHFSVMSVYIPSGSSGEERQTFKMKFLDLFLQYVQELLKDFPNLLIGGDFNICHTEIDIHNPKTNKKTSGFLPEEREWVSTFMEKTKMIDSFRYLNPDTLDAYSWWTYRMAARSRNKGWRIDYWMVANTLTDHLKEAKIRTEVVHSDHCPVEIELEF